MALNKGLASLPKDNGAGFLRNLSPSIKRHPYKGRQHFLDTFNKTWRHQPSEWTLLTSIDNEFFIRDFDSDPDTCTTTQKWPPGYISWSTYDAINNLLLIRMSKLVLHKDAALQFSNELLEGLIDRGLSREFIYWRSATCYGTSGAKQADDSWAPEKFPLGRSRKWSTTVLETALGSLDSDTEACGVGGAV